MAVWKGIPYAGPASGAFRWRAPQPVKPWAGVRPATANGAACLQPHLSDDPWAQVGAQSEDCLFLNVFAPAKPAKGGDAVMLFIHGGSFIRGSGGVPLYDGAALARRGVVVVNINYRLGRFGYFAHPALTAENADGGRLGNYGLMDQIAALQWVQKNIKCVRRRSEERHRLWRIGGRGGGADAHHLPGRQGSLRARHRRVRRWHGGGGGDPRPRPDLRDRRRPAWGQEAVGAPKDATARATARYPRRRRAEDRPGRPDDRRRHDQAQPGRHLSQGRATARRPDDRRQLPRGQPVRRERRRRQGGPGRRLSRPAGGGQGAGAPEQGRRRVRPDHPDRGHSVLPLRRSATPRLGLPSYSYYFDRVASNRARARGPTTAAN